MPKLQTPEMSLARYRKSYQQQLRRTGFRSWKQANERRGELILKKVHGPALNAQEAAELERLQELAGCWQRYQTNGSLRRDVGSLCVLRHDMRKRGVWAED